MVKILKAVELVNAFYDYNYDTTSIAVKMENGKIEWSDGWFVNSPESTGRILEDREGFVELFNSDELKVLARKGVFTHSGKYHADDIIASNILYLNDIISDYNEIKRINDNEISKEGLYFDIGKGQFDHHQDDTKCHNDGNRYSACSLLAEFIYSKDKFEKMWNLFLKNVELTDNNGQQKYPNKYAHIVDVAYGLGYSFIEICNKMQKVVESVIYKNKLIWTNELETIENEYKSKEQEINEKVKEVIEKNKNERIVILQEHLPAYKFKGSQIQFVIEKSIRDGKSWNLISTDSTKYVVHDMAIKGRTFIHKSKFMAVYESITDAIDAANCSINLK